MAGRLEGKVALVTGGASGIGHAIAQHFAREGAAVVIADIDADGAETTCAEIAQAGGSALAVTADVTREADCRRMVDEAVRRFGRLEILVNNAGTGQVAELAALEEEVWDRLLAVNLKGIYLCWKAAFPALTAAGAAAVLNMASVAGMIARPGLGAYGVTKAGVIYLTRILALEGAPHRIRVNALCPTWVWTPLVARGLADEGEPEEVQARLAAAIPLGRIATVEDVAAAAVFLASDEAGFLTGVALPIDGGSSLR